jgi:thioredoxin 1
MKYLILNCIISFFIFYSCSNEVKEITETPIANNFSTTNKAEIAKDTLHVTKTTYTKPKKSQAETSSLVEITDVNFENIVLKSDKIVLVDFCANWNEPCVMLDPIIEELATEYAGKVIIGKFALASSSAKDKNQKTFQKYQIFTIPIVRIFKNGKIVDNLTGAYPKAEYVSRLDKILGPNK